MRPPQGTGSASRVKQTDINDSCLCNVSKCRLKQFNVGVVTVFPSSLFQTLLIRSLNVDVGRDVSDVSVISMNDISYGVNIFRFDVGLRTTITNYF